MFRIVTDWQCLILILDDRLHPVDTAILLVIEVAYVVSKLSNFIHAHPTCGNTQCRVLLLLPSNPSAYRLTECLGINLSPSGSSTDQGNVCMPTCALLVQLVSHTSAAGHKAGWLLDESSFAILGLNVSRHPEPAHVALDHLNRWVDQQLMYARQSP